MARKIAQLGKWVAGLSGRAFNGAFPGWALRRMRARLALKAGYRALDPSRLRKIRPNAGGTADDQTDAWDLWKLRETSRDLALNNTLAAGLIQTMMDNVVGSGHRPQARTDSDEWNDKAEVWFADWAENRADVRGVMSFGEMQRLLYGSSKRDGDIGLEFVDDVSLMAWESEWIATARHDAFGKNIVNGVEMDSFGRPVNYWIASEHPSSAFVSEANPIPADKFLLFYRPTRFTQTRGAPILSAVIDELDHLERYRNATVVAAEMAACTGLVYTTDPIDIFNSNSTPGVDDESGATGDDEQVIEFSPGMQLHLRPGEGVEQIKPEHPTNAFDTTIDTIARFVGRHMGLPLELIMLNFSRSNFSNTRAALLEAHRTFEAEQKWFQRYLRQIWKWVIAGAIERGELEAHPQFMLHEWIAPGWAWVDMKAEIEADLAAIDNNLTTAARVIAKRTGEDLQTTYKARAREKKLAQDLGLESGGDPNGQVS